MTILRVLGDWRTYVAAGLVGLALTAWVHSVERDRARDALAVERQTSARLQAALTAAEDGRKGALADRERAEAALSAYAVQSAAVWREQAAASAALATQLTETQRRLRAAQEEAARATLPAGLDGPLPDGLRDRIACAGSIDPCQADAAAADPDRVSDRADDAAGATGRPAGGDDRA